MEIKVLMITYNRPEYTAMSLKRLCDTAPESLGLTIWDNGSDQDTRRVIKKFEKHPRVEQVIFNERNEKLRNPTNWFFNKNKFSDLLGKVDNDCLVPENWCDILAQAHQDIPEAGILGCWRFFPEDFNYEKASMKITTHGTHQILRNCWIEGSGYLMKREVIKQIGYIMEKETFTGYCIRAAAKGFANGWYYPFLFQEHMDDPRAPHTGIHTEEDFQKLIPLSARKFGIKTKEQWIERLKTSAQRLQEYSIDPYDYIGFKAKLRRKLTRLIGLEYFPKMI